MKQCSRCGEVKSHKEFQANRASRDGKRPDCKECCKKFEQERRVRDKEKRAAQKKAYYDKHKERFFERAREKHAANPKEREEYYRQYREKNKARIAEWWKKTPRGRFNVLRAFALKRQITEIPVTIDELMQIWRNQGGRCAVSGIEMTWRQGKTQPTSLSIDRIDNDRGYERDNVRLVCYQVNTFRGRWSDEQMLSMARSIIAHQELKTVRIA